MRYYPGSAALLKLRRTVAAVGDAARQSDAYSAFGAYVQAPDTRGPSTSGLTKPSCGIRRLDHGLTVSSSVPRVFWSVTVSDRGRLRVVGRRAPDPVAARPEVAGGDDAMPLLEASSTAAATSDRCCKSGPRSS